MIKEEAEVKKNIEWLNNEVEKRIKKIKTDEVSFAGSDYFDEGYIHGMRDVQAIANQLDETDTLSQEWIRERIIWNESTDEEYVYADELQNVIVPKQELPVIPKFVANWMEDYKEREDIYTALSNAFEGMESAEMYNWVSGYTGVANQETFARAWLDGYEVAEEQKYYVLDKEDATLLKKSAAGEGIAKSVGTNIYNAKSWKDEEKYRLTEQEIKDYDERYWPFAVKVEELEE